MLLYRLGPEGFYAVATDEGELRILFSNPYETPPAEWELGRKLEAEPKGLLAPVVPSKILGIGRNYVQHAKELGNPVPEEPLLFLKAPSALIGPGALEEKDDEKDEAPLHSTPSYKRALFCFLSDPGVSLYEIRFQSQHKVVDTI